MKIHSFITRDSLGEGYLGSADSSWRFTHTTKGQGAGREDGERREGRGEKSGREQNRDEEGGK